VAVIGIGGVGSWSAEALARSGIARLTLIDLDDVCITNTNRQAHALHNTIGREKVAVMAERLRLINPECEVTTISEFFTAQTAESLLAQPYDLVIDAIDSLQNKCLLIALCWQKNIPLVTVGGAGGRQDPTQIRCDDLSLSRADGLLRQVRKHLRQRYAMPAEGLLGIPAIFSLEAPVFPSKDGEVCARREDASQLRLDCEAGYGTASFVTGTFGFAAAAAGLKLLAAKAAPETP
jgi:tRNA A37 threonylcarbamoyladenosine dehydratase